MSPLLFLYICRVELKAKCNEKIACGPSVASPLCV